MFSKFKKIILSYISQYLDKNTQKSQSQADFNDKENAVEPGEQNITTPLSTQLPAVQNPLQPYWSPFCLESHEPILIKQFEDQGRPFTPEDYKDIFHKHVSLKNFLGEKKRIYLYNMWKDAQHIKNVLEPLEKMGIKYTLDLTGGSVRDFVLNKHKKIKDLDFMLSIQGEYISAIKVRKLFSDEHIAAVGFDDSASVEERKVRLIELCFLASKEEVKLYSHIDRRKKVIGKDNYHGEIFKEDRLMAVFKTDGVKTNYPIDILLTDFIKPKFVADFDFDICKASICFINPYVNKHFPKDFTHLISRFVADVEFWADVKNKTITYNTDERGEYHVDSAYDKHFPRIEQKYHDYRLLVVGTGESKAYFDAKVLERSLPKKEENQTSRKMKI